MLIRDLIKTKSPPVTIPSGKTIQRAMRLLIDNKIGSLVVVDKINKPIGIITERDIFHLAYRFRGDMMDMRVDDHMTGKLILGRLGENINTVAHTMTKNHIRHMPIMDDNDNLCGILSIGDIVKVNSEKSILAGTED